MTLNCTAPAKQLPSQTILASHFRGSFPTSRAELVESIYSATVASKQRVKIFLSVSKENL